MKKKDRFNNLWRRKKGASIVEYATVVSGCALVIAIAFALSQQSCLNAISNCYSSICKQLNATSSDAAATGGTTGSGGGGGGGSG